MMQQERQQIEREIHEIEIKLDELQECTSALSLKLMEKNDVVFLQPVKHYDSQNQESERILEDTLTLTRRMDQLTKEYYRLINRRLELTQVIENGAK